MAIQTITEQIEQVQAAIKAIETGAQEYRIGSRQFRRGDLPALYDREQKLLQQYNEQQYGTRVLAGWPR